MPEYLQEQAQPEVIAKTALAMYADRQKRKDIQTSFRMLRANLEPEDWSDMPRMILNRAI